MTTATVQRIAAAFVAEADRAWASDPRARIVGLALLDTLAAAFAGLREPVVDRVLKYACSLGEPQHAPVWVLDATFAPETAAFVNGVIAHALDYDDVAPSWRGHPSAVLLPALLALAARSASTGRDVVDAYIVGFEVGARLGRGVIGSHYPKGWHATATIGVIAATAACCRLLKLDADRVSHALGLAVAQAAGPRANFGSMAKPMHAGFAAASAVRATRLASFGISAADTCLDGASGFNRLYAAGEDLHAAFARIGRDEPELFRSGVEPKLYPMCYAAHRAVEAALTLRRAQGIDTGQIAAIHIEGSAGSHAPLLRQMPDDAAEARFSIEYGVAAALSDGTIGLTSFTSAAVARPDIRDLMARIDVAESRPAPGKRWSRVTVRLRSGESLEATVAGLKGGPEAPVGADDLRAKLQDCLRHAGRSEPPDMASLAARLADLADEPAADLFWQEGFSPLRQRREEMRECVP